MKILKKLSILILINLISNVSANNAISIEPESFDSLTRNLFEKELVDSSVIVGLPLSENDYKSVEGARKLYCASIADFTGNFEDGKKRYDEGMNLLNDFARRHSIRDKYLYSKPRPYLFNLINFNQSWLIDDKEQLKGMIFYKINKIIEDDYYLTDPLGKKGKIKFNLIYEKYCSK